MYDSDVVITFIVDYKNLVSIFVFQLSKLHIITLTVTSKMQSIGIDHNYKINDNYDV